MKDFNLEDLKIIINKQMEINGYKERFDNLTDIEDWFDKFTTTKEKEEEFKEWLREYLKKFVSKRRLEKELGRFMLDYGLKIEDGKKENELSEQVKEYLNKIYTYN